MGVFKLSNFKFESFMGKERKTCNWTLRDIYKLYLFFIFMYFIISFEVIKIIKSSKKPFPAISMTWCMFHV